MCVPIFLCSERCWWKFSWFCRFVVFLRFANAHFLHSALVSPLTLYWQTRCVFLCSAFGYSMRMGRGNWFFIIKFSWNEFVYILRWACNERNPNLRNFSDSNCNQTAIPCFSAQAESFENYLQLISIQHFSMDHCVWSNMHSEWMISAAKKVLAEFGFIIAVMTFFVATFFS